MVLDLAEKTALVTGASRGLGVAIASTLAGRGAKTAINYFRQRDTAQRAVEAIARAGGTARAFQADVRDEHQVVDLVAEVTQAMGPIDILVINATGIQPYFKLEELTWRHCLDQLEYFVKSPLLLTKAVVGSMKQRHFGRIINIGSEVFDLGVPEFANYVSAKGAQLGLTRSWANELAKDNITVNMVAPGWIPTDRHKDASAESKQSYAATVPLLHMGEPHDIAEAVAFLASDGAKFITGQRLSVNGGNTRV